MDIWVYGMNVPRGKYFESIYLAIELEHKLERSQHLTMGDQQDRTNQVEGENVDMRRQFLIYVNGLTTEG